MKYLVLITFFMTSLFAFGSFLQPSEAFKVNATLQKNNLKVDVKLGESIYIYKERFALTIKDNKGVVKNIIYPQTHNHDSDEVFNTSFVVNANIYPNSSTLTPLTLRVEYQGCSDKGVCYEPMSKEFHFKVAPKQGETTTQIQPLNETDTITQTFKSGNIGLILLTFFGFGLLLALTPCVFPMIPILSSIIVSQGEGMNAKKGFILSLVYVLAMSVAYTLAGVFAGLFGANIQAALQNPWVLSSFSALFVILALSMFGFFEIGLPASLQSKLSNTSSKAGDKGGFVGVAIMGFLSALIVGPCVAPPLAGALMYIGQTGDALLGGLALFVLSLGMGMPLLLIGIGAGKFMPRPGGWMNKVSQVFGVFMLFIAIWMLSRILDATITMALYAALFIVSSVYMGAFEPLYNNQRGFNALTKGLGILSFLVGITLFLGVVSGASNILNPLEKFTIKTLTTSQVQQKKKGFIKIHSLEELNTILEQNKGKKVMLDFYADWCVSCKELEHNTFSDAKVQKALRSYILVQADVTNNTKNEKELSQKFGIFGPPAILFFDENSQELKYKRIIGYKDTQSFLAILKEKS